LGPFVVFDVRAGRVERSQRTPEDYGLPRCDVAALTGGDASFNAAALDRVLRGEDRGAHRDALVMGAAIALECTGKVGSSREGVALANAVIDDGRAATLLDHIKEFGR
jgi:anthranilate phosphoribosyltransferase